MYLFVACDGVAASAYAKNLCGHDFSWGLYEREDRLGNVSLVQHTSDPRWFLILNSENIQVHLQ